MPFRILIAALVVGLAAGCDNRAGTGTDSILAETGHPAGLGGEPTGEPGDLNTVLARVGNHVVTGYDVHRHLEQKVEEDRLRMSLTNPAILETAVSYISDLYVWAGEARKAGVELTEDQRRTLQLMEAQMLAGEYTNVILKEKMRPPEEEILAYYNQHQADFMKPVRVGVRHILVDTRERAEDLAERVRTGERFEDLVAEHSRDEFSREVGGYIGFVMEGHAPLGFREGADRNFEMAVLPLEEGGVAVTESYRGWHVVRVERKDGGEVTPLEEVRDRISAEIVRPNFNTLFNEELLEARVRAGAHLDEAGMETFTGTKNQVRWLMEQAPQMPHATGEAEAYRRIAYAYPDNPAAPEAFFRAAHVWLSKLQQPDRARLALDRLDAAYPDSEWRKAGELLREYLTMDGRPVPSVDDLMAKVRERG
jgi:hypothetical protein